MRLVVLAIGFSALCSCQRPENIEAKERLSKPAPPDAAVTAAAEKIDVGSLEQPDQLKRVCHMSGEEIAARVQSFSFSSEATLLFGRQDEQIQSMEKTKVVQSSSGDFSILTTTGDGSEMHLSYVNQVLFLKNNNGQWRMSGDPKGERNTYRSNGLGVWRSFYDLFAHTLRAEKMGSGTHSGRSVIKYRLALPDLAAKAKAPPASLSSLSSGATTAGADPAAIERQRMRDKMSKWREHARPESGKGELWVDEAAGVLVFVEFDGGLVVGDDDEPARLRVSIKQELKEIGQAHEIAMPRDAIEEVRRNKMPVNSRALLEKEGIVAPAPPVASAP